MKKFFTLLMSVCMVFSLSLPVYATDSIPSDDEDEALLSSMLALSKDSFIEQELSILSNENSPDIIVAAVAFSKRDDLTEQELVDFIVDTTLPYLFRRVAAEVYGGRSPEQIDTRILTLLESPSESDDLKTILIVLLSDCLDPVHVSYLQTLLNSGDENLAFNALKVMEKVDRSAAIAEAEEIYRNYSSQPPAKINISAKVLSRAFSDGVLYTRSSAGAAAMSEQEFFNLSQEILDSTDSEELDHVLNKIFPSIAEAATPRASGFQGYTAYRDGVVLDGDSGEWHAAIIYGPETSMAYYIFAQATGYFHTTELVSYSEFLNGNSPKGYYRPSSTSLTSSQRDKVCDTANDLVNERIPYSIATPIHYSRSTSATIKHPVSDIDTIRCDGFVEYAYEYNDIRVFGSDSYWNVARVGDIYENAHDTLSLTPKKQASNYMVRIGSL